MPEKFSAAVESVVAMLLPTATSDAAPHTFVSDVAGSSFALS